MEGSPLINIGFLMKEDFWYVVWILDLSGLRIFIPFLWGGDAKGVTLNAFVIVRKRNSSQACKLERERKRNKSIIYSSNLKN